jgi:hypothetical protein
MTHKLNSEATVAVAHDYYWLPVSSCPHSVKVQLLGEGGVATYGVYHGDKFWTHWAPLPRRLPDEDS